MVSKVAVAVKGVAVADECDRYYIVEVEGRIQ